MAARLEHPTPSASTQKLSMQAIFVPSHQSAPPASPHAPSVSRSLSLPTPSPSPSLCSESSSTSSSNMLSFTPNSAALDPILRRIQQLTVGPGPISKPPTPSFDSPRMQMQQLQYQRHRPSPLFCPTPPTDFLPQLDPVYDYRAEQPSQAMHLPSWTFDEFRRTKSRVVRLLNLPHSSSAASQAIARLFTPANNLTTPTSTSPHRFAFFDISSVRMWTLREEFGGARAGEEDSVWVVFPTHAEACSALSLSSSISISTALESDLEPFEKLRRYEMNNAILAPSHHGYGLFNDRLPPSPTSPECVPLPHLPETGFAYIQPRNEPLSRMYQISSNPPNPRSVFRHGDWICASPSCAAHNFGRNIVCIGCGSPRLLSEASPQFSDSMSNNSSFSSSNRFASPRFAGGSPPAAMSSPSPSAFGFSRDMQTASLMLQQQQMPSKQTAQTHQLLTPSGRALAVGGKVQNVSRDPLSPCVVYWPDNEPLPEQGQIRPATASQVHQPPIMNTGNKGPIEHQPGDWICHKCEYLNWRRRKVCQTCYPFAEGNGDSVSAAMQAERLAYLASTFTQNQANSQVLPSPPVAPVNLHNVNQSFPRSSASPSIPFPSSVSASRATFTAPLQPRFPHGGARLANQALARRSNSTPEMPSGNVVYQTPVSPSRTTFSGMPNDERVHMPQSGYLLPSFLKNEIKPVVTRTPLSLSPLSSSSAELSFDECEEELSSPSSGVEAATTFYAQQKTGSGKLSNGSDSTSSLTLGGSIWSMDRDEDKKWIPGPDFLSGLRSRKTSIEPLRNI